MIQLSEIYLYLLLVVKYFVPSLTKIMHFSLLEIIQHCYSTYKETNFYGKLIMKVYFNVTKPSIYESQT